MKIQKNRSKSKKNDELSEWVIINNNINSSVFMGYDLLEVEGNICKYREAKSEDGKINYHIVTDVTTFYAEGGGQLGDTGIIKTQNEEIKIENTIRENNSIKHITNSKIDINIGSKVDCIIDWERRYKLMKI